MTNSPQKSVRPNKSVGTKNIRGFFNLYRTQLIGILIKKTITKEIIIEIVRFNEDESIVITSL